MLSFITFFSSISFAQMFLSTLLLLPQRRKNPSIQLFIILMVCCCCYLLSSIFPLSAQDPFIEWVVFLGGNALPGVFWLVGLSIFSDHTILKRWQYGVASLTLLLPLLLKLTILLFSLTPDELPTILLIVKYNAMLLEIVLTLHTLIIAIKHWRDDLIQERRYIRGGMITFSGTYILINICANQLYNIHWQFLDLFMMSLLTILVTGINTLLFKLRESSLFVVVAKKSTTTEVKSTKELVKINQAMDDEKLYRQEGVTIASFAKHLAIHEYKLRQVINGELDFRNFNDFLNAYRIKEVTENLVAPSSQDTPILTLALDSGFRSLSSFNKAFKTIHGITPTAYRKKCL